MEKNNFNEILDLITKSVEKIPAPFGEKAKEEVLRLKEMILDGRPPRIMLVGSRGAGKSSVVNAIFKKKVADVGAVQSETKTPTWHHYSAGGSSMDVLDTRGIGDSTLKSNFLDTLLPEVEKKAPDAILFLCKAKNVDSHIDEALSAVANIKDFIKEKHKYDAPIAALVTQVDELDPVDVATPPFDDKEKQENIEKAKGVLKGAIEKAQMGAVHIFAVSTYARFDDDRNVISNRFWNVDKLVEYLLDELPRSTQIQLARISMLKEAQKKIAKVVVNSASVVCAGIAATPIPVADIIPITATQVAMITAIGYIAGEGLSKESALKFMSALGVNVGAGFILREVARGIAKIFVGPGELVSATIAGQGTFALGMGAIAYFIEHKTIEEAKNGIESAAAEKSAEA